MNFLAQFLNQRPDFYFNVGASLLNLVITLFNIFVNPHPVWGIICLTGGCFLVSTGFAITRWKSITGDKK